jgi:hypothetical protein
LLPKTAITSKSFNSTVDDVCATEVLANASPSATIMTTPDSHPVFILIVHLLAFAKHYSLTTAVPVNTAD